LSLVFFWFRERVATFKTLCQSENGTVIFRADRKSSHRGLTSPDRSLIALRGPRDFSPLTTPFLRHRDRRLFTPRDLGGLFSCMFWFYDLFFPAQSLFF